MKIDVITVFPEMFRGFFGESILKRAAAMGVAAIRPSTFGISPRTDVARLTTSRIPAGRACS